MNHFLVERKKGESYVGVSIEYRIYPDDKQKRWLFDIGNKLRGGYNLLIKEFIDGKDFKDYPEPNIKSTTMLNNYLSTIDWFDNVPSMLRDFVSQSLITSIQNFKKNKKSKKPSYKKKTNILKLTTNSANLNKGSLSLDWDDNKFTLMPTLLKKNGINPVFEGVFHKQFKDSTVKLMSIHRKSDGNWYISLTLDLKNTEIVKVDNNGKSLGIDVGIKDMAITSEGFKYQVDVERIKKLEDRISIIQKSISRKNRLNKGQPKSKNYWRVIEKKGRLQNEINNIRKQYHRYVVGVLTKGKFSKIQVEDIRLSFMLQNKHLAKSTARIGIRSFVDYLGSVCNSKGIEFNRVDPRNTSKTCSNCGELNMGLKLSHREWTCGSCGEKHDRDINAAKNIKKSLLIRK
jgi:putative transposase